LLKSRSNVYKSERNVLVARKVEAAIDGMTFEYGTTGNGTSYVSFGGSHPWQADGWYHGLVFYARFRGNQASMAIYDSVDMRGEESRDAILSAVIYPYHTGEGHEWDGMLDDDEVLPFLQRLVDELAPIDTVLNPTSMMLLERAVDAMLKGRE
jgi:hypothetical protein